MSTSATFRVWRGDETKGELVDYKTPVSEGMVVLDAIHQIQAEQANDLAVRWNCKAGKCGSCSAEINGKPKLMCMARLSELPLDQPVTVEPMRAFKPIRDLVTDVSWNFRVKQEIKPFKPRKPDAPDGTWRIVCCTSYEDASATGSRNSGSASSAFSVRTCVTCCAITGSTRSSSDRAFSSTPRRWRCTRWTSRTASQT